ncbi:hypothetical protein ILUMI_23093, partial [Ignelater luminosus]
MTSKEVQLKNTVYKFYGDNIDRECYGRTKIGIRKKGCQIKRATSECFKIAILKQRFHFHTSGGQEIWCIQKLHTQDDSREDRHKILEEENYSKTYRTATAKIKCGRLYKKFSKHVFILDDESYFTLSNSKTPGNVGFYSSDPSTTPNDQKFHAKPKFKEK